MRGHLQNGLPGEVAEHSLSVSRIQHPVSSIPLPHSSTIPLFLISFSAFTALSARDRLLAFSFPFRYHAFQVFGPETALRFRRRETRRPHIGHMQSPISQFPGHGALSSVRLGVSLVIGFSSRLHALCSLLYAALYTGHGAFSLPAFGLAEIKGIAKGKGARHQMKTLRSQIVISS